jgi:hypothetical protein
MANYSAPLEKWGAQRLTPEGFGKKFQEEWESLSGLFFKYEACQYYTQSDDPSFEALTEGKLYKAARLISEQVATSKNLYDSARKRGVHITRVHAITFPLSYYLQYEFMSYLTSQQMGEEIRIVDLDAVQEVEIGDFLLFDNRVALVHNYVSPMNIQDGGWLVDSPGGLDYLQRCREILAKSSVTLDDFVVPDQFTH